MKLVTENLIDAATLYASPALLASMPVTNLQAPERGRVARSDGLPASQVIYGNLNSGGSVDAFAISHHNLSGAATLRLKLFPYYDRGGAAVYDSGTLAVDSLAGDTMQAWGDFAWGELGIPYDDGGTPRCFAHWFSAVGCASFEATITDAANTDGYIEIGRMVMGAAYEPEHGPAYGFAHGWEEGTKLTRTEGGSLRSEARGAWRRWEVDLNYLAESERGDLMDALQAGGMRRDMLVSISPGVGGRQERDYMGLVKMVQMPRFIAGAYRAWTTKLILEEV